MVESLGRLLFLRLPNEKNVRAINRGQNSAKLITKKVYLVRHGQTDYNLRNIVQGSGVDTDLNATGHSQADAFFQAYRHIPFTKIYTSGLKRTHQSVKNFIELGIPHQALPGLNEISWGTKEGHRVTPEEDEYYHFMLREWQNGKTDLRIEGGESPEDVVRRMKPALDQIFSQTDEHTILICMHGRAIRILLCHLLNYPLRSMDMFDHQNLCLYLLNYGGTTFSVERYNDRKHLANLATGIIY